MILLYHRVAELPSDPQWLCVTPQQFAEHLDSIRRHFYPLRLSELQARFEEHKLPRKAVVITFDDGYSDNLYQAKPLLEKYEVPATVFIATGNIGKSREFWWDELDYLLFSDGALPESLEITINGKTHRWTLKDEVDSLGRVDGVRWTVAMDFSPTRRHQLYRELAAIIRDLDESTRESVMEHLAGWVNKPRAARVTHRTMSPCEIQELAAGGLVDVGGHTVTHSVLSLQSAAEQLKEIAESRATLEDILSRRIDTFSYPFGGRGDYNETTKAVLREVGLSLACANFEGPLLSSSFPYDLPRFIVRDWGGEEFLERLTAWFKGQ